MSGFSIGNGLSTGSGLSAGSGFSRGGGFYFNGFSATPTPTLDLNFTTMTALPSTITFSRPSNATYYDNTGKLTYAPNNLLLNSATLSTQNVTTAPINYILSFQGTGSVARTGTSTGTLAGTGVADRVFVAFTPTAGTLTLTVVGSVTSAQLETVTYQTTPSTYVATTSSAYYGPRLDYNPATLAPRGLLIEDARTNLLTYSEQFSNSTWNKSGLTVQANSTVAPSGVLVASTLTENVGGGEHYCVNRTAKAASSITYTSSVYVKRGSSGTRNIGVGITDGLTGGYRATFNPDNGSFIAISVVGNVSGWTVGGTSAVSVGNGWWRFSFTATTNAATQVDNPIYITNGTSSDYAGDGVSNMYVWGAQIEVGPFATSYIPTAASSVARSADTAVMTGANFSSWYNQSEGTFVVNGAYGGLSPNTFVPLFTVNDGSALSNTIRLLRSQGSGFFESDYWSGNSQVAAFSGTTVIVTGSFFKTSSAYRVNDFAASFSGGVAATDTSGAVPVSPNRLFFGGYTSPIGNTAIWISSLVYYPQRLPNATLQSLTS